MRIDRHRSTLTFRKRRRHVPCLPLTLLLGLLVGGFVLSWQWLGERLNLFPPSQTSADLRGAARAFEEGDLNNAVDQAQAIWQSNPRNVEALMLLARALIYRSYTDYNRAVDRNTALTFTQEAFERMPTNVDVIAVHAFALHANGENDEAARLAARALRQSPNHAFARLTLSLTYGDYGAHEQAQHEAQKALAVQDSLDANRALALSLSDLGQPQEALHTIEHALDENGRLLALLFEKAVYALQLGDPDTATATYFRILAYDPQNIKARLRMCELSSNLRESDTALSYCEEVTERAPTWADGWYRLGREHYLRGEFEDAQDAFNRCTSLQTFQQVPIEERTFECWYLQGQIAEALGDCTNLMRLYADYQAMIRVADLPQTWTYPPEGPPLCAIPATSSSPR